MLKVFITNLGKYNEGELVGKWVELPVYDDELAEILDEIQICHDDVKYYNSVGAPYEEIFITDYECDDIPESCFLFAGTIDDVFERAKKQ